MRPAKARSNARKTRAAVYAHIRSARQGPNNNKTANETKSKIR